MNIEQFVGHAVSCLRHELNVVPAFLKASVSAWDSSLYCVHSSSAILGDQERQYQEGQREIPVWMTASASYWQDEPGWEIKGCKSWIKLWYFRGMARTAVTLMTWIFHSFHIYYKSSKVNFSAILLDQYFSVSIYFSNGPICMRVLDNRPWNFHFLKPFSAPNCTLYVLRPRFLNDTNRF